MALQIQFAEYVRRCTAKINSVLHHSIVKPEFYFYKMLRPILISFLLFFYFFMLPILLGIDYESMLKVVEFGVIGSGTLAILTFTYAIAKESKNREKIVLSGELLLKSTVTLILGFGLLPLVSYIARNHINISNTLGKFASTYDGLLSIITIYIFIAGLISLAVSGYFFIVGIIELIKVFETNSMEENSLKSLQQHGDKISEEFMKHDEQKIKVKRNYKAPWVQVAGLYIISILIGIFVIPHIFSFLGYLDIEAESARYLLSTIVQSEATIVAISISLSLVAIQLASSSYSIRMIELLKKYPDFWILLIIYVTAMIYGIGVLILIKTNSDNTSNLKNHIYVAFSFGVIAFLFLISYMRTTLDLLRPSTMIDMLAKEVTKENILLFLEGENKYEGYNIQYYVNRDKDPILPIIDIINSSFRNSDSETAVDGLNAIGYHTNKIFDKDDLKDNEEKDIIDYIIRHLHNVLIHAQKEKNDYVFIEIIKVVSKNALTNIDKKQKYATISAIKELATILKIIAKEELMGLKVLAVSFRCIEVGAAKNGLITVLTELEEPLYELLNIANEKGNTFSINHAEKAIKNLRITLENVELP